MFGDDDPDDIFNAGWKGWNEGYAFGRPIGQGVGKSIVVFVWCLVGCLTFLPATIWIFIRTDFGSRILFSSLMLLGVFVSWLFINIFPYIPSESARVYIPSAATQWTLFALFCIAFVVQIVRSAKATETGQLHSREMGVSIILLHPKINQMQAESLEKTKFDFLHVIFEPCVVYIVGLIIADTTGNNLWRVYFTLSAVGMCGLSALLEASRLNKFQDYRDQHIQQKREREAQQQATEPFQPREIDVPLVEYVYREDFPVLHPTLDEIYGKTSKKPPK